MSTHATNSKVPPARLAAFNEFLSVMRIYSISAFIMKTCFKSARFNSKNADGAPHEYSWNGTFFNGAAWRQPGKNAICSRALRLACVVFCVVLFCTLAQAQPSPARRAFAGRVLTDNGLPVGGASVTVRRQGTGSAAFWGTVLYSDARGDFSFADAEDGEYAVSIDAGGLTPFYTLYSLGEKTSSLQATLDRFATVSLRVLRSDGTPLASTQVSVLTRESTHGASTARRGTTDAQGVIAFSDVAPGVVSVRVTAPRVGYADLNDLKIAPGSHLPAFDATLRAGATLRIVARESAGEATQGAPRVLGGVNVTFSLAPNDASRFAGATLATVFDDSGGNSPFTRDGLSATEISSLAPGTYAVSLSRNNYNMPTAQTVEIKATETASLEFEMKRAGGVSVGVITLEAQNAKKQALANRDLFISMEMLAPSSDTVINYAQRSAHTDDKGRVVLYPLEVGRWRLTPRVVVPDAPAGQNSPNSAAQIATVTAATATDPAALTFSFAGE